MANRWYTSRWARIAIAAAFLAVLSTLAAPFLIPVDSYRPLLVWAIDAGTDRQVQIDNLKLYLLPTVRIVIAGFHLKNPSGFPPGDALTATSIDLGIDPSALLSRRLDVTSIVPTGVQVNVLRDTAGGSNFAQPVKRTAQGPGPTFTIEGISSINLTDADITVAEASSSKQAAPSLILDGVSGTIGSIDVQQADWAKRLVVVANLRGARLTTLLLNKPVELHSGTLTVKDGAGRATFSVSVGGVDVAGSAAFARLDPLSIAFAVRSPELDLDTLAPLMDVGARSRVAATSTPRYPLAHGTIAVAKVVFAPFEATRMTGQLDLYPSAVWLNAFTFSAYGGTVRGSAKLNGSAGIPLDVSARVNGLNVQRALAALRAGTGSVTGALDTRFTLRTLLARDPEDALTATGSFAVRNGSLPGSLNGPSGETSFSYLGGDMHIARERGYSNRLTLIASGMQGTATGSFGFDQSLDYSGHGVVPVQAAEARFASSSALGSSIQQLLGSNLQQYVGAAQMSVPFTLHGTLDHPQFALAGSSQMLTSAASSVATQQQVQSPVAKQLLQLIPGL